MTGGKYSQSPAISAFKLKGTIMTACRKSSSRYQIIVEGEQFVLVTRRRRGWVDATIATFETALGFPLVDAVAAAEAVVAALEGRGDYA
jgi:hypothetical protein